MADSCNFVISLLLFYGSLQPFVNCNHLHLFFLCNCYASFVQDGNFMVGCLGYPQVGPCLRYTYSSLNCMLVRSFICITFNNLLTRKKIYWLYLILF